MGNYAYEARTIDGELVAGLIGADALEKAGELLAEKGLFVIKLAAADRSAAAAEASEASRLKASTDRVVWFVNQLAIMIDTGINIGECIDCLARQATDPTFKKVLTGVSSAVQEGRPLSDALAAYPRTFPPVMTSVIRGAEASGTLCIVLTRIAAYTIKQQQIMRKFKGAMMYPALMLAMCAGVTVFLLTSILPRFAAIFAQKGAQLPLPTRILLGASDFVMNHYILILVTFAVLSGAIIWSLKLPGARDVVDGALLRMPVFGNLINKLHQSRTFRTAATLIEAGVPLSEALALTRDTSSSPTYQRLWTATESSVLNGEPITSELKRCPYVPESYAQMLDCGDRTGKLGTVMTKLADVVENEYDQAIGTIAQLIEPLMILFMGSFIGFIAVALLVPMFRASTLVAK